MGETIPIQGREITLEDIRLIQQLIDANPSWNRTRLSQELCLLWNWRAANGQIAVDDKEQVIVAADVSQNATDHAEFKPMVEQVERNLGALPKEGSADAGYSSYDNLEFAEAKGLDAYMPDNFLEALDEKEENEKRYHKSNFHYDEVRDTYICPEGQQLKRWVCNTIVKGSCRSSFYRGESCRGCAVREWCTTGEARTVSRDGREPLLEAMRQKLRREEGKRIYEKRGYTVEPVFGEKVGWQEAINGLA